MSGCCKPAPQIVQQTATISLDPCNALTETPDGLLAPQTELVGVADASCPPTSSERSVDIDVVGDGGCPNEWAVGARLSPCFGQAFLASDANLVAADGVYQNTPLFVDLPEAGSYELTADVTGGLDIRDEPGTFNFFISARLFNVNAGAAITETNRLVVQVHHFGAGAAHSEQRNQSTPLNHFLTVTGVTRIRLQAARHAQTGAMGNVNFSAIRALAVWNTRLAYKKVSD